jgi:hypothetical protein
MSYNDTVNVQYVWPERKQKAQESINGNRLLKFSNGTRETVM